MAHEFKLIVNGEMVTYTEYDKIPDIFDHVICFKPEIPTGPHTPEEHEEINAWNERLQKLMIKERNNASRN